VIFSEVLPSGERLHGDPTVELATARRGHPSSVVRYSPCSVMIQGGRGAQES
jgi:hypothetical protein